MPISKDQARELAKTFRDLSNQLGDFRFKNWSNLSTGQRQSIEDAEWTLLNYSSDFITTAVGIALNDMQTPRLRRRRSSRQSVPSETS